MVVYEREKLYNEVWEEPVSTVAKRYGISDVMIHKICKSMDIPVPPRGYWAKKRAGQKVVKAKLPKTDKKTTITRYQTMDKRLPPTVPELEEILTKEEYEKLYNVASSIEPLSDNTRYHKVISSYRESVDAWKKKHGQVHYAWIQNKKQQAPELVFTVSDETRKRVFRLLNALVKSTTELGCNLTENLDMIVRDKVVPVTFSEAKTEVDHVLTKQEERELAHYEEQKKKDSWAYRPNIRKYDHNFNGKLTMRINNHFLFRDTPNKKIEERLPEILFALYKASEEVRLERLHREEVARKAAEEQKRREERRERYNAEVDVTNALLNEANDFEIACRIRRYVEQVRMVSDPDDKRIQAWSIWALEKADWFDPTIARNDPALGIRKHSLPPERKKLEHEYSSWHF